jgi:cytochrome c
MKLMNAFLLLTTLWFSFTSQRSPQLWSEQRTDAPDSSRFTAMQLVQGLDEPMGMGILPNNNVLIVERKGGVRLYDAELKQLKTIAHLNVFSGIEDGLLGVAVDPDYAQNNWIYLYYGVGGEKWVSQLARYELKGDQLSQASKKCCWKFRPSENIVVTRRAT